MPTVQLSAPKSDGNMSLEACIRKRRSVREFSEAPLTKHEVGQLLWAAQGITGANELRAAPSAGGLYPLILGVLVGRVTSLPAGVYRYRAAGHILTPMSLGDDRERVASAALDQQWIASAPAVFYIAGAVSRTTSKYGDRGRGYVFLEAGHVAENLMLQAVSLGLNTAMVGAFSDGDLSHVLVLDPWETPLCLIPAGRS